MTTKTDDERKAYLKSLGLKADGDTLDADAPAKPVRTAHQPTTGKPVLAPEGVDPHTMPVTDIVFDPALLDGFPSLEGDGLAAASRHVFALYKSPGRNKDRHSLLHSRIGKFIGEVRRSRETGGLVKEKVKASKEQREIANLLASRNMTAADLAALIQSVGKPKKAKKKAKKEAK